MSMIEYIILAFSSLFVIIDPIAVLPVFLAMTPRDTAAQRARMAGLACFVVAGVLLFFSLTGQWIFRLMGVTLEAFQVAGSIVLLLVSLDMLRAQRSRVQGTAEEADAGTEKDDVAITPLAVPMLAGPGAITTSILLKNQADGVGQMVALCGCIVAVSFVCYLMFRVAVWRAHWLNPIAMKITTRIMGLLLAALAIQFMIDAVAKLKETLW